MLKHNLPLLKPGVGQPAQGRQVERPLLRPGRVAHDEEGNGAAVCGPGRAGVQRRIDAISEGDSPISGTMRSMVARKSGQSPSSFSVDLERLLPGVRGVELLGVAIGGRRRACEIPTVHGSPGFWVMRCETLPLKGSVGSSANSPRCVAPSAYHGRSIRSVCWRNSKRYSGTPSKLPSNTFSACIDRVSPQRYSMNWPYWYGLILPGHSGSRHSLPRQERPRQGHSGLDEGRGGLRKGQEAWVHGRPCSLTRVRS